MRCTLCLLRMATRIFSHKRIAYGSWSHVIFTFMSQPILNSERLLSFHWRPKGTNRGLFWRWFPIPTDFLLLYWINTNNTRKGRKISTLPVRLRLATPHADLSPLVSFWIGYLFQSALNCTRSGAQRSPQWNVSRTDLCNVHFSCVWGNPCLYPSVLPLPIVWKDCVQSGLGSCGKYGRAIVGPGHWLILLLRTCSSSLNMKDK